MKYRSPLFQGLFLLLLAVLIGSVVLRRVLRHPVKEVRPVAARASTPPPSPSDPRPGPDPAPLPPVAEPLPTPAAPTIPPSTKTPAPASLEIRGRLLGPKNEPVPFARVEAFALTMRRDAHRLSAETDQDGRFRIACPLWSRVTFTAHLPGCGRAFYFNAAVTDADHPFGTVTDLTLSLAPPFEFSGVVASSDGSPVAGARLRFHPISYPFEGMPMNLLGGTNPPDEAWDAKCRKELYLTDCEVETGAGGEFRAHSLIGGYTYAVEVIRPGLDPVVIDVRPRSQKGPLILPAGR